MPPASAIPAIIRRRGRRADPVERIEKRAHATTVTLSRGATASYTPLPPSPPPAPQLQFSFISPAALPLPRITRHDTPRPPRPSSPMPPPTHAVARHACIRSSPLLPLPRLSQTRRRGTIAGSGVGVIVNEADARKLLSERGDEGDSSSTCACALRGQPLPTPHAQGLLRSLPSAHRYLSAARAVAEVRIAIIQSPATWLKKK